MGRRAGALLFAALACMSTVTACGGTAKVNRKVEVSNIPLFTPDAPSPTATVSIPLESTPPATAPDTSDTSSVTVRPAPNAPVRTASFDSNGRHYDIKVWVEVSNVDCAEHAYGQVATFLAQHTCRGLTRQLSTTTVNGKAVGFDVASLSIPGSGGADPYDNAAAFRTLVDSDGTGSVNDLLREGYRLPSGPTALPSPDAFRSLIEDTGVNLYDIWYLDGPTPANDPALEQMAQDIYLAY